MSGLPLIENLWLDLRYAGRNMRKSLSFTLLAVAILGLGIGGTAAMFSVIRAVVLKPLSFPESERLVRISLDNPARKVIDGRFTKLRADDMQRSESFKGVGTFYGLPEEMALSGIGDPEALKSARVSANFLDILGVQPVLGRGFLPEEDIAGPAVAIISSALFQRRFGGDPQMISTTQVLNATPYSIVGVLPAGFAFPFPGVDVWVTKPAEPAAIPSRFWPFVTTQVGFARLKPQVSLEQARAELDLMNGRYISSHPGRMDADAGAKLRLIPMKDQVVGNFRAILWMLFGAVGFVALIACANVASLLLSRGAWRSREFAVRAAIGAGRSRLVGQLLVESIALALAGGILGIVLARAVLFLIVRFGSSQLPRSGEIRFDGAVLGFVVVAVVVSGMLSGLLPALQVSRSNLDQLMRDSSAMGTRSSGHFFVGARGLLVIGQTALSIVLLIGAGLLLRSIARLQDVKPGFQAANMLTAKVALSPNAYGSGEKRIAFFKELVRKVGTMPGVTGAAIALSLPGPAAIATNIQVGEQPEGDVSKQPMCRLQSVSPGYFRILGIPILQGREFSESDNIAGHSVVVVNQSFARRYGNEGRSVVGQVMREGMDRTGWMEIVGIVADVRNEGSAAPPVPEFYVPLIVHPPQTGFLALRTAGDPLALVTATRQQVFDLDGNQPISDIATMEQVLATSIGPRRLMVFLLGSFALAAFFLAAAGIYGVISYSVAQRTKEIGIRRALGANQTEILWLLMGRGLALVLAGSVVGIAAALALRRFLEGLLFQIQATDPLTYAGVAILFVAVAVLATYIPAHRAIQVDPAKALRIA